MQELNISERELEVLQLISKGLKAREIAKELYLSPYTVNTHRKSMIEKLSARNVANLISISFAKGLLKA